MAFDQYPPEPVGLEGRRVTIKDSDNAICDPPSTDEDGELLCEVSVNCETMSSIGKTFEFSLDAHPFFSADRDFRIKVQNCQLDKEEITIRYTSENIFLNVNLDRDMGIVRTFSFAEDDPATSKEVSDYFVQNQDSLLKDSGRVINFINASRNLSFLYLELAKMYPENSKARRQHFDLSSKYQAFAYGGAIFSLAGTGSLEGRDFGEIPFTPEGYSLAAKSTADFIPVFLEERTDLDLEEKEQLLSTSQIFLAASETGGLTNVETDALENLEILSEATEEWRS